METLTSIYRSATTKFLKLKRILLGRRDKIQDNVYFPFPLSQKKKKLYFATDNTDLKTDTRDGKNQLQGQLLWHIKMKPTKRSSLTLLLCKTQFIKLNTVSLQTLLMQNVKIMFHFVQLIKSNFILQMIQSGMY